MNSISWQSSCQANPKIFVAVQGFSTTGGAGI